jgi:hypothetical protein
LHAFQLADAFFDSSRTIRAVHALDAVSYCIGGQIDALSHPALFMLHMCDAAI